jgi:ABC-type protease/lipase transport system fused ATPase/permease subunit
MKSENKNRKTFVMFLLAFLIGFFVVSLIEVLRSSFFVPVGPNVQTASAVSTSESVRTHLENHPDRPGRIPIALWWITV